MTYGYENLGDDRFQQLCQAILTTEHNDVQCLPVGQPDGGRDALIRSPHFRTQHGATVFQVKFSKDPSSKDERTVIEELVKTESAKVERLREHGLQRYYLLTNVSGTSHFEAGSIDRVNDELSRVFQVPAYCWWRDDLDRRIDANSSIKWSFPEIIRGTDLLQGLYEGRFPDEGSRRLNAIKAYMSYQYKYDSQLKFKQVDLEKGLVDLFVDVPAVAVGPADPREREKWRERFKLSPVFSNLVNEDHRRHSRDDEDRVGAVRALVDPAVTAGLPRVVIEGAPGQGKSTVTQFLCQLHRMLLLKKWEISRVPADLRPSDVRLPLRVDLRDYATWLSGHSPFQDAHFPSSAGGFSPALESFLAAQISAQSGGLQFSPDDLLAFAANSALLIVLDGFDEVADVNTRNRLVREISDASTRFDGNSISCQVVVTSRPAAFANSPGFPKDEWQYIQILPLTKTAITIYTDKWISGHNMDQRERREITGVLSEKLEYPHVRELARNPMQLAILLALISTQGASLPDKRTTLYDRYVDIFFNRESEKSKVVRDKRDLLIGMHRYLAWTLQVEAENDAKAGNISEHRLREIFRAYLNRLGHDPALVDALFVGMVERVVVLVSRVQGTFEFEVQPLREYFAARYLYDTAPYIQAGSARSGSIMDRFDALARNAYWLNVTRFYCGCYSTGELPSLVDGLIAIGQSEQYVGTTYLSDLALTLLGDYVFSQQPRSVARLADFLFSENQFRVILASIYDERGDAGLTLPEGSGRSKLLNTAIGAYNQSHHFDTAFASAALIKANLQGESKWQIWEQARAGFSSDQALQFGSFLDIVEDMPGADLIELINAGGDQALRICVYRDRIDVLSLQPAFWQQYTELSLDGRASWLGFRRNTREERAAEEGPIRAVLTLLGALSSLQSDEDRHRGRTLLDFARRFGQSFETSVAEFCKEDRAIGPVSIFNPDLLAAAANLIGLELVRTSTFEREVSTFLDLMVRDFGHRALTIDAAIAALEWFGRGAELIRHTGLLATLAEFRAQSGNGAWWRAKFAEVIDDSSELLLLKAFLAWIDDASLADSVGGFSALLDTLPSERFHALYSSPGGRHGPYAPSPRELLKPGFVVGATEDIGSRAAALLSAIVSPDDRDTLFKEVLCDSKGSDRDITDARTNGAWYYAARNPEFWPSALAIIADGYSQGCAVDRVYSPFDRNALPADDAKLVVQKSAAYPLTVVSVAARTLTEKIGSRVIPVGSVAAQDQWFADN